MRIAGFWRRFLAGFINCILIVITFYIYFIFYAISFFNKKPSIGMKAAKLKYDGNLDMGNYFMMGILYSLFSMLIIPSIIQFFRICFKMGTFAEKWSGTYHVIDDENNSDNENINNKNNDKNQNPTSNDDYDPFKKLSNQQYIQENNKK